jgi:hypothetical protein
MHLVPVGVILRARMAETRFGLCDACVHQRRIENSRGSVFSMCDIGLRDPDWPKYPRTPVLECPRFEEREER